MGGCHVYWNRFGTLRALSITKSDTVGSKMIRGRGKFVELISRWIDPRYLVGPVVFVAALHGTKSPIEAGGWALVLLATAILPVLCFIRFQTKRGAFIDNQVPERHLRNQVYLVSNSCLLVSLLLLRGLSAPRSLIALLAAMLASSVLSTCLNLRWKISVHTGATAGAAVALLALLGPRALPALVLIPLVGWTRLTLCRHTLSQVIAGAVVGVGVTALVFWLMSPL
jgi:membrane-associated phospholipid phosphatase